MDIKATAVKSDSAEAFSPNWRNIIFLSLIYGVALVGWPIYFFSGGGIEWADVGIAFFMYLLSVPGICVGYHRALSHKSFKMNPLMKFLCVFSGSTTGEGSALSWVSDHRRHHRYEDTPKDPYNVNRSFWWAHMGWLLGSPTTTEFSNCRDLERSALLRNQHNWYIVWFVVSSFVLPTALGALFGRPLAGLLFGGFVRLIIVQQFTFMINSYAHYFGRRPYSKKITARDSLLCAIMASGEGWHNYHHRFPFDYRNGHKFYHWDPAKWIIQVSAKLGMATDLKSAPPSEILKACVEAQKDMIKEPSPAMKKLTAKMEEALKKWEQLSFELAMKKEKRAAELDQKVKVLKQRVNEARDEFKRSYVEWQAQVRQNLRLRRATA
jgi:stearoyl-CoA desaturase (delta-9 desaturase)